jgi:hypothetical protein
MANLLEKYRRRNVEIIPDPRAAGGADCIE